MLGDVSDDPFLPIAPSSLTESRRVYGGPHSQKYMMAGFVVETYPPSHDQNRSKNQYEYLVSAIGEFQTYKPIHCILADKFGGSNDFETYTLKKGQKVRILCIQGNPESGIIIGGIRNQEAVVNESLGHFWQTRFNSITRTVDKNSTYSVKHDKGNELSISTDTIVVKDGTGLSIMIDKKNSKIVISDDSGESITLDKKTKKLVMNMKDLAITATGDVNLTASGKAKIVAKEIVLNKDTAGVVTGGPNGSHSYDFMTGIPIPVVNKVRAG